MYHICHLSVSGLFSMTNDPKVLKEHLSNCGRWFFRLPSI